MKPTTINAVAVVNLRELLRSYPTPLRIGSAAEVQAYRAERTRHELQAFLRAIGPRLKTINR